MIFAITSPQPKRKHQIRNSKLETNSNVQTQKVLNDAVRILNFGLGFDLFRILRQGSGRLPIFGFRNLLLASLIHGVHRPERVGVSTRFDVIQRFVDGAQWEIARRYMARVDDTTLYEL